MASTQTPRRGGAGSARCGLLIFLWLGESLKSRVASSLDIDLKTDRMVCKDLGILS